MKKIWAFFMSAGLMSLLFLTGCSQTGQPDREQDSIPSQQETGKVIYIDPYAGDAYDLPADLILVTHSHFDHSQTDKVEYRNEGCQTITQKEAVLNGEHQIFDLGYVTVETVEAGYNPLHDVNECVGYVLTFSNGKSVYVTGDTSTTDGEEIIVK
ncbi:MAG: MBL fold metallo-hydrolase [Lachnospiraceae bacterium]|nr:MBL fold metallo-hydrolase [Lachnospiraceae bacterium]